MNRKILGNISSIFIPLTLLFSLFAFSKIEIMEDYFHLYKIQDGSRFITTILSTLATIISITVALAILSFNTFKQKAGEYAIAYFINIKHLHYLVSLYSTAILLVFISLVQVSKNPNPSTVNLIYFNIYLFIITFISMIVLSVKLFQQISMSGLIKYYFLRITKEQIADFKNESLDYKSVEKNLKRPLFILEDLGLNYLRKGDFVISNLIYADLTNTIINFIREEKEDKNIKQYLEYLSTIYRNCIPEAISKNNDVLLSKIWNWFILIHGASKTTINRSHIFWNYFKHFGCGYYETLIKNNKQELADEYFEVVNLLFLMDKNSIFPDEKEIHLFNSVFTEGYKELYGDCEDRDEDEDFLDGINEDWQKFIERIVNIYYSCGEFNLKINNEIGLLNTIKKITDHTVFGNSTASPLKTLYIFRTFYPLIREFVERGIERNIFQGDMDKALYNINPLKKLIRSEKILYEKFVLNEYGNLIIFLQKHGLVSYTVVGGLAIGDFTLPGDLGKLIHHYTHSDDDELNFDCLKKIVEVIAGLKNGFEKDLKKNNGLHFQLRERLIELEKELSKLDSMPDKGLDLLKEVQVLIEDMNNVKEKYTNSSLN